MKSLSICSLLILFSTVAFCQNKKVPAEGEGNSNETEHPYTQLIQPEGVPFTEVTLWGTYIDELDTQSVRIADCYPDGNTKQEANYTYATRNLYGAEIKQKISKVQSGVKKDYSYDAKGNVIHTRFYEEYPANSIAGVMAINTSFSVRMNKLKNLTIEDFLNNEKRYRDSFLRSKPPAFYHLLSDEFCSYDENGNPTCKQDTVKHSSNSFSYTYNANGQVTTERQLHKYYNKSNLFFYNTKERIFNYNDQGKLLAINTYMAANDSTSDIATAQRKTMEQVFHYNNNGLPDTISFIETGIIHKHIIEYGDSLKTNYTILRIASGRSDTVCYYHYTYNGNKLTEIKHYDGGQTKNYARNVYNYNKDGKPIEMLTYVSMPDNRQDQVLTQQLFFYGDKADDAATAKRSLYIPPAKRDINIRLAAAEKQKGIMSKTDMHKPAKASGMEQIFTYVEQMPTFPGDINAYISEHLNYPAAAKKAQVAGRVTLRFVVHDDGSLSDYEVQSGLGYGCDEAAIKMLMAMPKWRPGTQNGKAVAVYYTLPVYFKIH